MNTVRRLATRAGLRAAKAMSWLLLLSMVHFNLPGRIGRCRGGGREDANRLEASKQSLKYGSANEPQRLAIQVRVLVPAPGRKIGERDRS